MHLNSPTNKRVSEVVIRRVLLKRDVRKAVAVAFELSIVVNGCVVDDRLGFGNYSGRAA